MSAEMKKTAQKEHKVFDFLRIPAVFIMAVLFAVFFLLFVNGFDRYSDAGFIYSFATKAERMLLAVLALAFFCLLYYVSGLLLQKCTDRMLFVFRIIMWCLLIVVQAFFLFYVRSYYKWDSGFVIGGAASLAEKGTVADEAFYYLSVYPNQNTFVLLTAILIKIGNVLGVPVASRPFLFNIFNTIMMDVSVALLLNLFAGLIPEKKRNVQCTRMLLLLLCNPFLYLGVSYYYTITLSWPLTMGFLYLIWKKEKPSANKKKFAFSTVVAGILLGIGYELRATAVIFAIAGWMVAIGCVALKKVDWKKLCIKALIVTLSAILSSQILAAVQKNYVGIDTTDTAFPTTHWLMMSLTMPGGHNADDESFTASFATKEEKKQAVNERLKSKLQDMGVGGYIRLATTKTVRTFGDGMNGYTTFLADGYGTGRLYDVMFGVQKDLVVLWHQGYYLLCVCGILLLILHFIKKMLKDGSGFLADRESGMMMYLMIVMIGAIMFYVLWEASEQYSVPFMPIMLLLAGYGAFVTEARSEFASVVTKYFPGGVMLSALFAAFLFAGFAICRYPQFVLTAFSQSHTAATQILANAPTVVDDGEILVQKLTLSQPFNKLIIQWRNPDEGNNDAVYELTLRDVLTDAVCTHEIIDASQGGYNGAGIYEFETVVPKKNGQYEICIQKTAGSPEHDLQFVLYDMYGYTPYPGGDLCIRYEDGNEQVLSSSLLFLLTNESDRAYTTPKRYIFWTGTIFLCFLFMGFCSKIEEIGSFKKKGEL